MNRLVAFACFACAAFAWVPPFLDRVGTAALGLAFLALSLGGSALPRRPALFAPRPHLPSETLPGVEPIMRELDERLAAYTLAGGAEADEPR